MTAPRVSPYLLVIKEPDAKLFLKGVYDPVSLMSYGDELVSQLSQTL